MSHPTTLNWLPVAGNLAAIAPLQSLTAAGPVDINSNLPFMPNVPVNTSGIYEFNKVARSVSITSANNNAGVVFTITGFGYAITPVGVPPFADFTISSIYQPITTTITGVNNNTVQNLGFVFKKITSITASAAFTNISVGFGSYGITDYIFTDYNRHYWNLSVGAYNPIGNTISYTFYGSLIKPEEPNSYFGNLDVFPYILPANKLPLPGAGAYPLTTSVTVIPVTNPYSVIWATIVDGTVVSPAPSIIAAPGGKTNSLYITTVQQGTCS